MSSPTGTGASTAAAAQRPLPQQEEFILLSVIVPCYNGGATLPRCLRSLTAYRAQRGYEVVVVDDGSSPSEAMRITAAIEEIGQGRMRRIVQRHQGAGAARNAGIAAARGSYLWMVDADDCVAAGSVDALLALLRVAEDADLVKMGPMIKSAAAYAAAEDSLREERRAAPLRLLPPLALLAPQSGCLDHTTYLYRRDFLWRSSLRYPEGMALNEDSLFVLHCLQGAATALHCPWLSLYYIDGRRHTATRGRWGREQSRRFVDDCILFFEELQACCAAGFVEGFAAGSGCVAGCGGCAAGGGSDVGCTAGCGSDTGCAEDNGSDDGGAAGGDITLQMRALYDRYLYVYCRVLAVKCCPWNDIARFRCCAAVGAHFYFLPARSTVRARLLANAVCHRLLRQVCCVLRAFTKRGPAPSAPTHSV